MKQTALFNQFRERGVGLVTHHGWQVPAFFTSSLEEVKHVSAGAGLSDVSWLAKFDLKGPGVAALAGLGGAARSWPLTPRHALVTCDPAAADGALPLLDSLRPSVYLTDVTSVYAAFLLAGPRSRDILRKLTSLNVSEQVLTNLSCGQTSLAHVHARVLRQDFPQTPAFLLMVGREYGESVWDALFHAGGEFHLTPFGLRAHEILSV
jgi:glycine cleavage system aminomethyltransferase T